MCSRRWASAWSWQGETWRFRGNFCTVDESGAVVDRRAGRIPTSESAPLAAMLDEIDVPGVELAVHAGKDYRFVLLMRGEGLGADVRDTEPRPPNP